MKTLHLVVQCGESLAEGGLEHVARDNFVGAGPRSLELAVAFVRHYLAEHMQGVHDDEPVLVVTLTSIRGTDKEGDI